MMTTDEKLRVVQTLAGLLIESKNNSTILGVNEKTVIQGKLVEVISSFDTGIYAPTHSKVIEKTFKECAKPEWDATEPKMESVVDGTTL